MTEKYDGYDDFNDWVVEDIVMNPNVEQAEVRKVPRMTTAEIVDHCISIHEVAYETMDVADVKVLKNRTDPDGWDRCNEEIRCIWADQLMTRPECLTGKMYLHRYGWYHGCMIYQPSAGADGEMIYEEIRSHAV